LSQSKNGVNPNNTAVSPNPNSHTYQSKPSSANSFTGTESRSTPIQSKVQIFCILKTNPSLNPYAINTCKHTVKGGTENKNRTCKKNQSLHISVPTVTTQTPSRGKTSQTQPFRAHTRTKPNPSSSNHNGHGVVIAVQVQHTIGTSINLQKKPNTNGNQTKLTKVVFFFPFRFP